MAKKFVRYFVTSARLSTGFGIKVFCLSYSLLVFLDLFFSGLQITYIIESKEWLFQVSLLIGRQLKPFSPRFYTRSSVISPVYQ